MEKEIYEQIKDNVQNIEINIYTNIKGEEKKPVLFTRSLLKNIPSNNYISLSDTPFFVTNYQIPYNYIKKLSLEEKINTLFNKQLFTQTIFKNQDERSTKLLNKTDETEKNVENNIKTLLKLLFPTYYPVKGNHTDTYSELIQEKLPIASDFSSYLLPITSVINNITKKEGKPESKEENPTEFSYLNIGGKVYTVVKVVYLNDFINNPKYKEISNNFFIFKKWKEKKNEEIEWDIIKLKNKIIELMNNLTYDLNIPQNKCDIYKQLQKQYLTRDDLRHYNSISENYKVKNENIEILLKYLEETLFNHGLNIDLNESRKSNEIIKNLCDNENIVKIKSIITNLNQHELISKINNLQKLTKIKNNENLDTIKESVDNNYNDISNLINSINEPNLNSQELQEHLINYKEFFDKLIAKLEKINIDKIERKLKDNEINNIYNKQLRNKPLNRNEKTNLDNYKTEINNKYSEYLDFLNAVSSIYTSSEASIQFTYVFNNSFSTISSLFKKLKLITKIKSIYFENDTDILQDTSDEIKKYFEESYKEYNNFIQVIKKFLIPNRESNNEKIVDMISNYVSGNVKELTDFLTNINNEHIENYKNTLHIIYDELHNPDGEKSKYEIQIYVDLIEGKLTKSILKNIGCYFKDNELVNLYYKRLYKNKYANKYEFNGKIPVLKIEELNASPDKVKRTPEKMGGQRKSKRMKIYRQKCKKCRLTRKSTNV